MKVLLDSGRLSDDTAELSNDLASALTLRVKGPISAFLALIVREIF